MTSARDRHLCHRRIGLSPCPARPRHRTARFSDAGRPVVVIARDSSGSIPNLSQPRLVPLSVEGIDCMEANEIAREGEQHVGPGRSVSSHLAVRVAIRTRMWGPQSRGTRVEVVTQPPVDAASQTSLRPGQALDRRQLAPLDPPSHAHDHAGSSGSTEGDAISDRSGVALLRALFRTELVLSASQPP